MPLDISVALLEQRRGSDHRKEGIRPSPAGLFKVLAIHDPDDQDEITTAFRILCELVDEDRNHIWSYYVRLDRRHAAPLRRNRP
ncbi:hypothetical protein [Streptomyces glaucus]|uniref:Transposase n=1 Tax=Streptomyces glaucus TaxID=284029 RepID=A0ABN3JJ69_9ACTN